MRRRHFLSWTASAAALAAACSPAPPEATAPRRVIVVGAGLAGLVAAWELTRAGHDVTVLEAKPHVGGRVHTLRAPFADGLYAEAGALFIPDVHDLALRYARAFDLPLDPVPGRASSGLYYVRGRRSAGERAVEAARTLALTAEEERLGYAGMWRKYVEEPIAALGDPATLDWASAPMLERYDRMSGADFLRARGASPGAVALLRLGYLDLSGEGLDSYSALPMLRDLGRRRSERATFAIRGGNDALPRAFAARLGRRVLVEAPVVRLEPGERRAAVVVRRAGGHQRLAADHVVCAVPFSVLRHLEVAPPLSAAKRAAIRELPYTSVMRVYVQTRRRFWVDEGLPGSATTDLPIQWIWEPTVTQPAGRGILESYTAGAAARRLAAMSERERVDFVLGELARVYPGVREQFEAGASKGWDEDPWARGAYAWVRPGQMTSLLPHVARPEGRIHFAGEHASTWPQWMQGALESGLRAAREVTEDARAA